jgi:hypothetical protein
LTVWRGGALGPGERKGKLEAMSADLLVIGCVSQKRATPSPARDLYTSDLWARRRRYAEASGIRWVIFSAEYAIVDPDTVIAPYDRSLKAASPAEIRAIGERAARGLEEGFGPLHGKTIEVHADAAYVSAREPELRRREAKLIWPLQGLRVGEQLHWYDVQAGGSPRKSRPEPKPSPLAATVDPIGEVALVGLERLGPFTYRWPTNVESFERGWNLRVKAGGQTYPVRHGIGRRVAYGRERARTVTWVGRWPKVEGVGADDYDDRYSFAIFPTPSQYSVSLTAKAGDRRRARASRTTVKTRMHVS